MKNPRIEFWIDNKFNIKVPHDEDRYFVFRTTAQESLARDGIIKLSPSDYTELTKKKYILFIDGSLMQYSVMPMFVLKRYELIDKKRDGFSFYDMRELFKHEKNELTPIPAKREHYKRKRTNSIAPTDF